MMQRVYHRRNAVRILVRSLHSTPRRPRELFDPSNVERPSDDVDVCIVGAGPAGLSAAIRLKQLEKEKGREIRVVVLEKGAEVGECSSHPFNFEMAWVPGAHVMCAIFLPALKHWPYP